MNFLNRLFSTEDNIAISGLTKELNLIFLVNYYLSKNKNLIILTSNLYEANKIYEELSTFINEVFLFPADDFLTSKLVAVSPELKIKRLETLENLQATTKKIVITNLIGYLAFLPKKEEFLSSNLTIKIKEKIERHFLEETIQKLGYKRTNLVIQSGDYALRGFVLDIFLLSERHPIRIEFFGEEVETIKYFDENTQMSIEMVEQISLKPFEEIKTDRVDSLFDYLANPVVFYFNYEQIKIAYEKLLIEITEFNAKKNMDEKHIFELSEINVQNEIIVNAFYKKYDNYQNINYTSTELENFNSNWRLLQEFVNKELLKNRTIVFCLSSNKQIEQIREVFKKTYSEKEIVLNAINVIKQKINKGFIINNYVVISEFDIENIKSENNAYQTSFHIGQKVKGFEDINIGDYIVHTLNGIGIYRGIKTLTTAGINKDYLQIDYADNDKIYLPVEKINSIYKYGSGLTSSVKLNNLGTGSWEKTKRNLSLKINNISKELLELYAKRSAIKSTIFKNYPEEEVFGSEFDWELTSDQAKSIKEINSDLENPVPMERLLCGDVGFGKTEVAFRGIFKTILNNYQVLYLCPTTILSNQQWTVATNRFKNWPIKIKLLNRFTTLKERTRILRDLSEGKIDLLIGTHSLLNEKIKPYNLGLLIIDEEQRFGVGQKEKIKKLKNEVNILSLSATPIPRTLKMALSGIRDLSLIDTPPVNRYPVQTYVVAENDLLIKDAIYQEMARNGQVFVLYNKIDSIISKTDDLKKLIPEVKIAYAHGAMKKHELENIMLDFIAQKFDVLVCTTIIEAGIDIPNVNTLIIYDADNYGLSQLYQIKGRVGRTNRLAYAYLMFKESKMLSEIASKRLNSIKDFAELGSGYKIAMRDLEIRGAGDIFGSQQAGFISAVGVELFMKLVEDEIKRQKGEIVIEDSVDFTSLLNVGNHIQKDYIDDDALKIEIHKKISSINSEEKLEEVSEELKDRFGTIPEEIKVYMLEKLFECDCQRLKINNIKQNFNFIEIDIPKELSQTISLNDFMLSIMNISSKFKIRYFNKKIIVNLNIRTLEKHFIYYLVDLIKILKNMSEYIETLYNPK